MKNNKVEGLAFYIYKTNYKVMVILTVGSWHKDRYINQWHQFESPKINNFIYIQSMFQKHFNTTQWKNGIF